MAGIATDITHRKRAEVEVQEALRRRDQFLAMLAHELRNPLEAILNATAVSERQNGQGELQLEARGVIRRQTLQMARLLEDLLDVSRITHHKIESQRRPVNFSAIVEESMRVVKPTMTAGRIELTKEADGEPLYIIGDAVRLQQMLVNLLTNAAKFTPPDGHVRLTLSRHEDVSRSRLRTTASASARRSSRTYSTCSSRPTTRSITPRVAWGLG